jgi:hypothetical protein
MITHQAIEAQKLQHRERERERERESQAQIPEKGTDSVRQDHNKGCREHITNKIQLPKNTKSEKNKRNQRTSTNPRKQQSNHNEHTNFRKRQPKLKRKAKTSYLHHPSQKRKTKTTGNTRRPVFPTQGTCTTQNQKQTRINNHRRTQITMEYPEQEAQIQE